jgi:excisionase family DNA binding protein
VSKEDDSPILSNEILTIQEVATYLRVSRTTVWRWCHQGVIPACQVGRSWRIRRDQLLEILGISWPDCPDEDIDDRPVPGKDGQGQPLPDALWTQQQTTESGRQGNEDKEIEVSRDTIDI